MGTFLEFIRSNLSHVAPVLIAGLIGLSIIIERFKTLYGTYALKNETAFFEKLRQYVYQEKMNEALALCEQNASSPVARVVKAGLLRANQPEEWISEALHLQVGELAQEIQKRTAFLATIANVATLLGLFGTIAGLIASFEAVGHADPQQKSALLAAGISTAMNATMLGLGVAIPCMVAFSVLINKSNRLNSDLEHAALKIADLLRTRYWEDESHPASARSANTSSPEKAA